MTTETLIVWQNHQRVGTLWRGADSRLMGFEYDTEWQASGQAISNSLPLHQRTWPPEALTAHHWFGNLLPEEQARAAIIRQLGVPDDDFSLLTALGGDCAGALSILPPHQLPEPASSNDDGTLLPQERLNEWAAFQQRYALFAASQPAPRPRLSLAGAQDKIPVIWREETFYLPQGTAASSHIIKFAVDGRDHVIFNELYLNTLAKLAGIECPRTSIRYAGKCPLLVVERYDRAWVNGSLQRVHQEDLCQAMGRPRTQKYQEHGGPTLADCFHLLREVCRPPAPALQQLLRWQIFNILVGNSDGHAKNVSLLQDAKGKWRIAPAYDLVGTIVLGYDPSLAFSIGNQNNTMQLLSRDWKQLATQSQISYPFIKREIERLKALLLRFVDSTEMQQALIEAGLSEGAWPRLQQQRHHIVKQCKKAAHW